MYKRFELRMEGEPDATGGGISITEGIETQQTEPAAPTETAPTPTNLPEWLKGVDPELAADKSLSSITDMNNLVKSYIHAQKAIGQDKITLPGEFASEDDWKAVYKKLGLPDKLEEYKADIAPTEYFDETFKTEFLKNAHTAGILPKQAKAMFEFFNSQTDAAVKKNQEEYTRGMEEQVTKLKEEWGAGFAKEIKVAQIALKQFADDSMINEIKESGLDSHPTMIKLLNKIGKNLNEDTFARQTVAHLGITKEEAQGEYGKMMNDMTGPYWNADHPNHKAASERMLKLQEIINSQAPQA